MIDSLALFRDSTLGLFNDTMASWGDIRGYAEGTDYLVEIDMPGATAEGLDVSVREGILHVSWKRKYRGKEEKYQRALKLGSHVDTAGIEASLKDGVLVLRLPQKAATEIKVKVA